MTKISKRTLSLYRQLLNLTSSIPRFVATDDQDSIQIQAYEQVRKEFRRNQHVTDELEIDRLQQEAEDQIMMLQYLKEDSLRVKFPLYEIMQDAIINEEMLSEREVEEMSETELMNRMLKRGEEEEEWEEEKRKGDER